MAKDLDFSDLGGTEVQPASDLDFSDLGGVAIDSEEPVSEPMSKSDSALEGLKQGTTLGFADELEGAIGSGLDASQALLNKLGLASPSPSQVGEQLASQGVTGDLGPQSTVKLYRQMRDEARAKDAAAQQANPLSYMGGAGIGGLLTAPLVPTSGPLAGTGLATKALSGARSAAPAAAIGGAGLSQGDLTTGNVDDTMQALKEVGSMTALGAGVGAALPVIGAGIKGAGNLAGKIIPERVKTDFARGLEGIKTSTQDFYEKTMLDAQKLVDDVASPILAKAEKQQAQNAAVIADADKAIQAIEAQTEYANKMSQAKQVAQTASEANALNNRTVELAEKLQNQVMDVKKELGKQYNVIDDAAEAAGIRPENREIIGEIFERLKESPLQENQINSIIKKLEPYLGKQDMTSFRGLKSQLNDLASQSDFQTRGVFRDAYSKLNNQYAADLAASNRPELAQQLAEINKRWSASTALEDKFLSNLRPDRVTGKIQASPDTIRAVQTFGEKNPQQIANQDFLAGLIDTLQPKAQAPLASTQQLASSQARPLQGTMQEMAQLAEDVAANKAKPLELPTGINPELDRLQGILNQAKAISPRKIEGLNLNTETPEGLKGQLTSLLPKAGMKTGDVAAETKLNQVMDFLRREQGQEAVDALQKRMAPLNENLDLLKGKTNPAEVQTTIPGLIEKAVGGAGNVANAVGRSIKTTKDFLTKGASSLNNASPETIQTVANELASKGPQGKVYSQQLMDASKKNPQSRNAVIFGLMQQPAFRKMFSEDEDSQK